MVGLEKIFNCVTVMVIRMVKDGESGIYPVDVVRKKQEWIAGQPLPEIAGEKVVEGKPGNPVLVVFTGYGIIRKVYDSEKSDEMERITGSEEFIWDSSGCAGGERTVFFTRRERVALLLERFEADRVPVVGIYVTDGDGLLQSGRGEEVRELALFAVDRFYGEKIRWKKLAGGEEEGNVLAGLITRKIRFPLLMSLLFLLLINYVWNGHIREAYRVQRQDLIFLEKDAASREKLSEKMVQLVKEFRGNRQVRFTLLFDRIAALVPPEINLETLVVNPLLKNIEERKPLVIREGYVSLTGSTAEPGKVTAFTGNLSGNDFARQVKLISLDRSQETGLFHFSILIEL